MKRSALPLLLGAALLLWPLAGLAQRPIDARRSLEAQRALYRHPELIDVEVQSLMGVLYLRGTAPSRDAIRRAEELASGVEGVTEVRNRVRLNDTSRPKASDEEILAEIQARLGQSPELDHSVRVSVRSGSVALSGAVANPLVATWVTEAVRGVEGVRTLRFEGLRY
jgi:osmotically-inducible protein OsmY